MCATEVAYNFKREPSQNICNINYSEKVYRYMKSNFQDYKYKLMQNFEHLTESIMVPGKVALRCIVMSNGNSFCP